jgi:hypothetical protein
MAAGVCLFGMPRSGPGDPQRTRVVVDGVPDTSSAGDFVLPLFERCSTDFDDAEGAFQRVLSLIDVAGIAGQRGPGAVEVVRDRGQ